MLRSLCPEAKGRAQQAKRRVDAKARPLLHQGTVGHPFAPAHERVPEAHLLSTQVACVVVPTAHALGAHPRRACTQPQRAKIAHARRVDRPLRERRAKGDTWQSGLTAAAEHQLSGHLRQLVRAPLGGSIAKSIAKPQISWKQHERRAVVPNRMDALDVLAYAASVMSETDASDAATSDADASDAEQMISISP